MADPIKLIFEYDGNVYDVSGNVDDISIGQWANLDGTTWYKMTINISGLMADVTRSPSNRKENNDIEDKGTVSEEVRCLPS